MEAAPTVVEDRLYKGPTLGDKTSMPVPQLVELTRLCLRSIYFQLLDKFHEQTDGAAMGSPLSPVIANLYLESLEDTCSYTISTLQDLALGEVCGSSSQLRRRKMTSFPSSTFSSPKKRKTTDLRVSESHPL